ncbi:MAG TPA: GNAT family N-acetyltransferase [Pseudonocardiaceae bacterium]|nr:GNAT family N-acetyltransferase [Pseudonocardiaceae bacterium]
MRGPELQFRLAGYDDPDAGKLIADVQEEYVRRYGGEDSTPVDPAEFSAPAGLFLVGYVGATPVACGGWRAHDTPEPFFDDGDAEVKRMYVAASVRRRGYARMILAELERTAADRGRRRMVLETGTAQPEAIALYTSAGYTAIRKFGQYRGYENSRCYGKML